MKKMGVELKSYISCDDTKLNNEYSWLIMADGKEVGYVNLVRENFNDNFLVVDIKVKDENKRIKESALKQISQFNIADSIVMKSNNKHLSLSC